MVNTPANASGQANPSKPTHLDHALLLAEWGFNVFPLTYPRLSSSFTGDAPKSTEKYTCSCHATRFRRALQPDELKRGMKHVYERGVCTSIGKHPITIKSVFEGGHKGATRDVGKIRAAWTKHPDANIGIGEIFITPNGETRRIIAFDVDGSDVPAEDGELTMKALTDVHGALPPTMEARSGRIVTGRAVGGRHVLYMLPLDWTGTFKRTLGPGVDVKCAGMGFVAAPPSLHKSGNRYEWTRVMLPAEIPTWLLEAAARDTGPQADHGGKPQAPVGDPFEPDSLFSLAVKGVWWQETSGGELEAIEAALRAIDTEYDPARTDRVFLSPDLFKELHWSIRALQDWFPREPGIGELAFAHTRQFGENHEENYFKTVWNYRRSGKRVYGKTHLLALADQKRPGWRWGLSDDAFFAAARILDQGLMIKCPYETRTPGVVPASETAGVSIEPGASPALPGGSHGPSDPQQPGGGGSGRPGVRPIIRIQGGGLPFEADAAERYLTGMNAPIFTRGQTLVHPITEQAADCRGAVTNTPALLTMTPVQMRDVMTRNIAWEKYDGRAKKWLPANPGEDHAKTLLSRAGKWTFPLLRGVASTPILRRDGSLACEHGYDARSKMFLERPLPLPWFSDTPTKEDALRALGDLDALIKECAFVDDEGASRAAALSALITPGVRSMMEVTPIHVANAPKAGTGKSFLYDLSALIWLGDKCPAVAASEDPKETEKRLVGAVIRGLPIINLDNVSGELSSDFLCQASSQGKMQIRPLGTSADALVPNTATIFASGNNIVLRGDITRRTLVISLDAMMEDPERRVFKQDPVKMVRENRGHYVACALTIVKAYIAAGSPRQKGIVLNGYEDWCRLVRDALMWLGCADSVETMTKTKAADPDKVNLEAVVTALREAFKDEKTTLRSASVIVAARNNPDCGVLREVLTEWGRGEDINLRSLGKAFAKFNGQIVSLINDKTGVKEKFRFIGKQNSHLRIKEWGVEPA